MALQAEQPNSNWTFESNTKQLYIYLFGMASVGLMMIYLFKGRIQESQGTLAAYWGGILLVALAVGVFLFFESAVIQVDNAGRRLLVQKKGQFGKRSYAIPFHNVASVLVSSIGKSHRGIVTHHLILQLKNGKKEVPGRVSVLQSEIIEVAERLASDIGCECIVGRKYYPMNANRLAGAALGSVLIYLLYYRLTVGPWCLAMWFGTAPPLIIALSFMMLFRLLRRA